MRVTHGRRATRPAPGSPPISNADPNKDAMMAQAELAQATNRPDLAQELPVDPQARAETRARAAHSVATFAHTSALEALDALLAAEGPGDARAVADAAGDRSRLLDAEVARFRALADQTA
jgi:hypothetical protein